ncbi:site-specific integrase [Mycolicibacterium austroafricanum]|uniref:site-specific integrase n=1 Tax=Mycolicibacterium austroafricanum TaxID=39687 RepID=UPI001CA3078A|nr:tyrosine-type recombinase/integrase [Mycolicibacterium austroafricanum]QZT56250.1 tyrosine-type recombinase/integrase [Mycolicibacterium austroafricanum]
MAKIPEFVTPIDLPSGRRYEVRVEVTGTGKRQQKRKRFRTLKEAVDFHQGTGTDRSRGVHVAPSELTVQQAVDGWLLGQRIRPKTRSAYVTSLRPIVDHLGAKKVQDITKNDVEEVVQALRAGTSRMGTWNAPTKLKKSAKKVRSKWAATSINPMLARTRSVFDDLVNQGIIVRNPAALVKPLVTDSDKTMNTLAAEQVTTLLNATDAHCYGIAWRLAVLGLRRGEILALRWDAVDFDSSTLAISAARLATAGGATTGAPKTKSSVRTLPMPEDLAAALRRGRKRQLASKLALGSKWVDSGYVVVDELGNAPYPDTLTAAWRKALAGAGLPHVRLHDARHSCATLMHLNGVPTVVIAAWLGHQDAGFTLRTYTHSNHDALADAAAMLGAITTGKKKEVK